ncbi:RNA helicase [Malassezia vespertilionis]|uniref:RNA helicase n=1 Tax=Malassezia vespertilionis TaxID=2020962 RepID=UPI0024B0AAB5|nr:RNA helicase [Malassezia vespertilionis]WFD04724.1 RNA helicase [Malassezia vespertilionis]
MSEEKQVETQGFHAFAHLLDARILRALANLGYGKPTPVQRESIEYSLSGKTRDILAKARTGSGKTLAYGLPIIQKIILAKSAISRSSPNYAGTRALILVPTRELAEQVNRQLSEVLTFSRDEVQVTNVARSVSNSVQKLLLSEKPDVVVATPSRALACLRSQDLVLSESLQSLVIDEADLIFSYGHDTEVKAILGEGFLSRNFQTFLMSATLGDDTEALRGLVLKDPVVLKLKDDVSLSQNLLQYYVNTSEENKFLLIYVILKLRLIRGKCLLFVNDIDRCYRLKLFLEQFGLRTCVLNEELPVNSRFHIVEEFNKGKYDYIIATDTTTDQTSAEKGSNAKASSTSKDYGVSRGIDFVAVACVVNFDLPTSERAYTHRIGRTARAGNTGTALSFVVPSQEFGKKKAIGCPTCRNDETVWQRIEKDQQISGNVGPEGIQLWKYDKKQVDAFRYRMEDALRSVTRTGIKEARIQEIKNEILNSKALKAHFEENPKDLEYLRHDRALHPARVQQHMRHIPSYLRPRIAGIPGASGPETANVGYVAKHKTPRGQRSARGGGVRKDQRKRTGKKKSDPLRSFS